LATELESHHRTPLSQLKVSEMPQEQGILPNVKMPPQIFCKIILKKINKSKSKFSPILPGKYPLGITGRDKILLKK
jgi:hypothetical protein